jgi:hypothetical protein
MDHNISSFLIKTEFWEACYGQIVWVKTDKLFWPGYIYDPELYPDLRNNKFDASVQLSSKFRKDKFVIYFYISDNFGLISPRHLYYFNNKTSLMFESPRSQKKSWTDAVSLAKEEFLKPTHLRLSWHTTPNISPNQMDTNQITNTTSSSSNLKTRTTYLKLLKKNLKKVVQEASSNYVNEVEQMMEILYNVKMPHYIKKTN